MTKLARRVLAAAVALATAAPGPVFAQVARLPASGQVKLSPAPVPVLSPLAAPSFSISLSPAALAPSLAAPSVVPSALRPVSPAPSKAEKPTAKALLEVAAVQAAKLGPKSGGGESKAVSAFAFDGASGSGADGADGGGAPPSKAAFLAGVREHAAPGTIIRYSKVAEIGADLGLGPEEAGAVFTELIQDGHIAVRDNRDAVLFSFRGRLDSGRASGAESAADAVAAAAVALLNGSHSADHARAVAKAEVAVLAYEAASAVAGAPLPQLEEAKALRGNAMLEFVSGMLAAHKEWLDENADTPKLAARALEAEDALRWLKTATWQAGDAPLMPESVHRKLVALVGSLNPQDADGEVADGYIAALDLLEKFDRRDILFSGASKTAPAGAATAEQALALTARMRELDAGPGDTWTPEDLTRAGRAVGLDAAGIRSVLSLMAARGDLLILSNGIVVWFDFRELAESDAGGVWDLHGSVVDALKLVNRADASARLRAVAALDEAYAAYLKLGRKSGPGSGALGQASIALANAKLEAFEAALRLREKALSGKPGTRLDAVRAGLAALSEAWYSAERLQRFTPEQSVALARAAIAARLDEAAGADSEAARGADLVLEFIASLKAGGGAPRGRSGSSAPDSSAGPLSSKAALAAKLEAIGAPEYVRAAANDEFRKLADLDPRDSEAQKLRTYLEWLLALPWSARTVDTADVSAARAILDRDHAGLASVKERVLEFLAVRKRTGSRKGAIIAFTGPPGVGKTSIASAIAEALGRKFARLSLGGVHDESVMRGHGRTYTGSMPGEIIRQMKAAGTVNPVMLMDEADKIGRGGAQGDPTAALLEILDPEQNSTYRDRYLDVPYDLSEVLFIVTANELGDIPAPLRDRMEIIEFDGYTTLEKIEIAERHIVPEKRAAAGLAPDEAPVTRDAIRRIIEGYTMEAGVRGLREKLGTVMRKISAWTETRGEKVPESVGADGVAKYLGVERFSARPTARNGVGVATGLSVNAYGGSTLNVEVSAEPGAGRLLLRKQFGDDIADSAMNAYKFVKTHAAELGLAGYDFTKVDVDVNITPAGKIDGPSAGGLMVTAIVSALTGRPVKDGVAMTGEITMRGDLLPIGGLKQKVMAAHRMGYAEVIFPEANLKDLESIPREVREGIKLTPVRTYAEIFPAALEPSRP